jgi:hypothetical protein
MKVLGPGLSMRCAQADVCGVEIDHDLVIGQYAVWVAGLWLNSSRRDE